MTADRRFSRLDKLVQAHNDVLDEIQEARRVRSGTRPELEARVEKLMDARTAETRKLIRAGVAPEAIEAHLDATDRHRRR